VDKDFAEITACKNVWPKATVSVCWWHICDALRKRTASSSLDVDKYDPAEPASEFSFIDEAFLPPAQVTARAQKKHREKHGFRDEDDYNPKRQKPKKNTKKPLTSTRPPPTNPNVEWITPAWMTPSAPLTQPPPLGSSVGPDDIDHAPIERPPASMKEGEDSEEEDSGTDDDDGDKVANKTVVDLVGVGRKGRVGAKWQFCPEELRKPLIEMVELHLCTHMRIPGHSAPSKEGIRWWAVEGVWNFCVQHDLRELWAYLWINWYTPSKWTLWARSENEIIPRLKTTMICESQYVLFFHSSLLLYVDSANV
jgi:hypothetical protein